MVVGRPRKVGGTVADRTPPQPIDYSRFMPSEAETYGEVSEDELSKLLSQGTDPQTAGEEINDMDELHDMLHHPDNNDADSEDGDDIEEVDW